MKLTWIYPTDVASVWPVIESGMQEALDNSDNLLTLDSIRYCLVSGQWKLYVGTDEETGDYLGFATIENLQSARGMWLNIPFAYCADPDVDLHPEFFRFLEEEAEKQHCVGVTFISKRRGYERKAKSLGYEIQFVKYKKEL